MRERLIAAFVGLTIAIVALYGIPRAYVVVEITTDNERAQVDRAATLIAIAVQERESRGEPITPEFLTRLIEPGERLDYTSLTAVQSVGRLDRPANDADIERIITVSSGSTVTLVRSEENVTDRVVAAVTPVLLIGIAMIMLSAVVGFFLARRMAKPFRELADLAEALGTRKFDVGAPVFRVREAREIARALQSNNSALNEQVRRQHEFAANVSHQLRTPITALRLELEDLLLWPDTPDEIRSEITRALGQLDRLSDTVAELLEIARGEQLSGVDNVSLDDIVRAAAGRWSTIVAREKRALSIRSAPRGVSARVAAGPLHQVLDVLIDNALRHGSGEISLFSRDAGTHGEISVADEGDRPMGQSIFLRRVRGESSTGEGIGLAVAKELAEAVGGHLRLDDTPHTSFTLMLLKPAAVSNSAHATTAESSPASSAP